MGKLLLLLVTWSVAALSLIGGACSDRPQDLWVYVEAEVVEPLAPVEVHAGTVAMYPTRLMAHEVTISWREDFPAILDDSRFRHRVPANKGELVVAGPGCSFMGQTFVCTGVWLGVRLEPGESHAYQLEVRSPSGPLRVTAGTYVVEQPVRWWRARPGEQFPNRDPDGTFTIRLTYTVE